MNTFWYYLIIGCVIMLLSFMENVHVMYNGWTLLFLFTNMNIFQNIIRLMASVFISLNSLLFCVN